MKKIITIGRECGSGGHSIALKLSEKLGIPCYDKEIISMVAEKCNVSNNYAETAGELLTGGIFSPFLHFNEHVYPYSTNSLQNQINSTQVGIIEELADKGACIIVGRGADYILRHRDDVLNVFIKAPMKYKIELSKEKHNLTEKDAKAILLKRDKERSKHYYFYTGQTWGDAKNYHIVLDSSMGEELCVDLIAKAYSGN